MKRFVGVISIATVLVLVAGCNEKIANIPRGNQTPKTFLWLYPAPDSSIGVGVSRQQLHWWGEDPDGTIRGYLFAWDTLPNRITSIPNPDPFRYTWVTSNDTLMAFPLRTLLRDFTVAVKSADNTFKGLPLHSIVRLNGASGAYWDKNDNDSLDAGDEVLPDLLPATDPVGAIQTFPIRNTPPTIALALSPLDPTQVMRLPDTTFTAASVSFKGSDADGDNTLVSYRIGLNIQPTDTILSHWVVTPIRDTVLTLVVPRSRSDGATGAVDADVYGGSFLGRHFVGTVHGLVLDSLNKVLVQAKDVAGEYSTATTIVLPSGTDHWFVKKPRGRLLLVSDFLTPPATTSPIPAYLAALAGVPGGAFTAVDVLDIGRGPAGQSYIDRLNAKAAGTPGAMVQALIDPALIQTFLLYDYVIWYTDKFPSLGVAQLSIFPYLQNQGKVIFSANFSNVTDTRVALRDIAPLDSIDTESLPPSSYPARGVSSIPAEYQVIPDSSDPTNIYPALSLNSTPLFHSVFMRPLYRRSDASYIYHLQPVLPGNPVSYIGTPNIGVVDGQHTIVFIGLPLHLLDGAAAGGQGLTSFLTKALTHQFNSRRVDRRKF